MNDQTIVIPSCETCRFKHDPTEANCWFVRIKEYGEPKLCWEYSLYEPLFGYVKAIKQEHTEETDTGISIKDTSKDLPMNNEQNRHLKDKPLNDKPTYTGNNTKKFKPFSIRCDINSDEDLDNLLDWIDLQN